MIFRMLILVFLKNKKNKTRYLRTQLLFSIHQFSAKGLILIHRPLLSIEFQM
jgi:hypothetical protein